MATPLRIDLCGGLAVSAAGRPIDRELSGHQGRSVLAYLLVHRTRSVERSELVNLLWQERAPRDPESALNTVLARLRRAVGRNVLGGRRQLHLNLPEGSVVDVDLAEAAAREADWRLEAGDTHAALAAGLRGAAEIDAPFLPDAGPWVASSRAQIEDLRARLLLTASRCALMIGGARLADGAWASRRLIDAEPYRESGYGSLMEIHAARGDVAEALLVYEQLRTRLQADLGIVPSADLAQLHQSLLVGPSLSPAVTIQTPPPAPATLTAAPAQPQPAAAIAPLPLPRALARERRELTGRAAEQQTLDTAWKTAAAEEAHLVALEGEAGIGKTALLRSLARRLNLEQGAAALYGAAVERPIVPYAPVVEALRAVFRHEPDITLDPRVAIHLGELGWLFPEFATHRTETTETGGAFSDEARRYQALAAVLTHTSAHGPALICLDDMHLADADTCALLIRLMRDPTPHPILWVIAYRGHGVGADHPLTRLLEDARRDPGLTPLSLTTIPQTTEVTAATLEQWWLQLTPSEREVMEVVSLMDDEMIYADRAAAVLEIDDARPVLTAAVDAGLMLLEDESSGCFTFTDPLLRTAVLRQVRPSRRAALRRRLADTKISPPVPTVARVSATEMSGPIARARAIRSRPSKLRTSNLPAAAR